VLTALPSRSTSTSKWVGTSGAAGATKLIARERTGRLSESFWRMAWNTIAAIRPPKAARPWAQVAGMHTPSGLACTASSNWLKFMGRLLQAAMDVRPY